MKKTLALAAALLLGLTVGAGPAAAAPVAPPGAPNQPIFEIEDLAGICAFPIDIVVTGKGKDILLTGGRIIAPAPGQVVTITNATTGESVTYVITGATHKQTLSTGNTAFTVTGRNVVFNDANSDKQGIFLLVGTFRFVLTPQNEEVEAFDGIGQVTDVCAILEP